MMHLDWKSLLGYYDLEKKFTEDPEPILMPDHVGPLIVWQKPIPGKNYVVGSDVAEGVTGGDYSCASVIDGDTGEIVAAYRALIAPIELGKVLFRLGYWYNRALVAVEKNNHGYATLIHLLDPLQYPNVYRRMAREMIGSPTLEQFGWVTNVATRRSMFHVFRSWFIDNAKRVPWLQLLREMQGMRYTDNGREDHPDRDQHGDRAHDDTVVAQAIAISVRDEAHRFNWFEEPPDKGPATEEEYELDEFERLVADRQVSIPTLR